MSQIALSPFTFALPPVGDPAAISIGALNELLRGEIAASETYRHAAGAWKGTEAETLRACERSHETRMKLLRQRIEEIGGRAAQGSGLWGIFARSAEGAAFMIGPRAVLKTLMEGEDHGLEKYHSESAVLDEESHALIRDTMLPMQEETLALMRDLLSAGQHA
jgi:hypothetical protein